MKAFPTLLALAATAVLAVACGSDEPILPDDSPLAGLLERDPLDSVGTPPPAGNPTPGTITGTVLGESEPGAGNDSLETAPRINGAVLVVYPVIGGTEADPDLDDPVATVTTGADGTFTFPELPAGVYVVTVTPPVGSGYTGVWIRGQIDSASGDHPWWVVLDKP